MLNANKIIHHPMKLPRSSMFSSNTVYVSGRSIGGDVSRNTNTTAAPNYSTGLAGVDLTLDIQFVRLIWVSMVGVALIVLTLRLWQLASNHIRHIYCLNSDRQAQNYWTFEKTKWWPWLKREVIYAPLGRKRHNREIQLSRAANYGTLPGRVHVFLLVAYVMSNLIYCLVLPYGTDTAKLFAELRGRTGMLATVNLIPLVLMAARNNPSIAVLRISFDTFNLFHRWFGRIVLVQSTVHVGAWYANYGAIHHARPFSQIFQDPFLAAGLCGVAAMGVILFQSLSAVRHAFYEIFLHLHILLAFTTMTGIYIHLDIANLPALPYIRTAVILWFTERVLRLVCIVYLNCSWTRGWTFVTVEALPADACRITFHLPRHITVRPGSHVYAYLPRISWWQSHPFSVAWTNVESEPAAGDSRTMTEGYSDEFIKDLEKQHTMACAKSTTKPTSISLIVAARTGMTRKLFQKAQNGTLRMSGFIEGPYAGHDPLSSYGTVVMFAGGAGITHHLVQIRHLIACASASTVATRKILLVWTVRDLDALIWIRPWMDEILQMPGRRKMLNIELYVTKPRRTVDYTSPSSSIQLFLRRCNPETVLDNVIPMRVGAMMVSVCGPGAFADEVRAAVRSRLHIGCIEMNEEAFTW